ncbi:hypothetical protein RI054_03g13400 [Pseudoscourfieldia marina]
MPSEPTHRQRNVSDDDDDDASSSDEAGAVTGDENEGEDKNSSSSGSDITLAPSIGKVSPAPYSTQAELDGQRRKLWFGLAASVQTDGMAPQKTPTAATTARESSSAIRGSQTKYAAPAVRHVSGARAVKEAITDERRETERLRAKLAKRDGQLRATEDALEACRTGSRRNERRARLAEARVGTLERTAKDEQQRWHRRLTGLELALANTQTALEQAVSELSASSDKEGQVDGATLRRGAGVETALSLEEAEVRALRRKQVDVEKLAATAIVRDGYGEIGGSSDILVSQVIRARAGLSSTAAEVGRLRDQLREQQLANVEASEKVEVMTATSERALVAQNAATEKSNDLQDQLGKVESENRRLTSDLAEMERRFSEVETRRDEIAAKLALCESRNEERRDEIAEKLALCESRNEELSAEARSFQTTKLDLERTARFAQEDADRAQEDLRYRLSRAESEFHEKVGDLEQRLASAEKDAARGREEADDAKTLALRQKSEAEETLRLEASKTRAESDARRDAEVKLASIDEKLRNAQRDVEVANQRMKDAEEQRGSTEHQLKLANDARLAEEQARARVEEQLMEMAMRSREERKSTRDDDETTTQMRQQLQDDLRDVQDRLRKTQDELRVARDERNRSDDDAKARVVSAESQLRDAKERMRELEQELRDANDARRHYEDDASARVSAAESQMRDAKERIRELEQELRDVQDRMREVQDELRDARDERQQALSDLDEVRAELEDANAATLAMSAEAESHRAAKAESESRANAAEKSAAKALTSRWQAVKALAEAFVAELEADRNLVQGVVSVLCDYMPAVVGAQGSVMVQQLAAEDDVLASACEEALVALRTVKGPLEVRVRALVAEAREAGGTAAAAEHVAASTKAEPATAAEDPRVQALQIASDALREQLNDSQERLAELERHYEQDLSEVKAAAREDVSSMERTAREAVTAAELRAETLEAASREQLRTIYALEARTAAYAAALPGSPHSPWVSMGGPPSATAGPAPSAAWGAAPSASAGIPPHPPTHSHLHPHPSDGRPFHSPHPATSHDGEEAVGTSEEEATPESRPPPPPGGTATSVNS